jgi:hypothetical protein
MLPMNSYVAKAFQNRDFCVTDLCLQGYCNTLRHRHLHQNSQTRFSKLFNHVYPTKKDFMQGYPTHSQKL